MTTEDEDDVYRCPFCDEEVRPNALKCKHCGEFFETDEGDDGEGDASFRSTLPRCSKCIYVPNDDQDLQRHMAKVHRAGASSFEQKTPRPSDVKGKKISQVGEQTAAGLACPKCGGTQFKTKRSKKAKVALGVFALATKGSQVRCVTCSTVYKRG